MRRRSRSLTGFVSRKFAITRNPFTRKTIRGAGVTYGCDEGVTGSGFGRSRYWMARHRAGLVGLRSLDRRDADHHPVLAPGPFRSRAGAVGPPEWVGVGPHQ